MNQSIRLAAFFLFLSAPSVVDSFAGAPMPVTMISSTRLQAFSTFDDGGDAGVYRSGLFQSNPSLDSTMLNNRHSASDWLYNMRSLPKSSVLQETKNPVITIALWSTFVSVAQRIMARGASQTLQNLSRNMCIGATPHSLLVSSLGLLLVFRTNSAYQRFYVS